VLKEIRWYLETVLFLSVSRSIAWLPAGLVQPAGKWLGRLLFLLLKRRRLIAIKNISDSFPYLERQPGWVRREPAELARETFENLGRSVVEDCKVYNGKGQYIIDAVEFRGLEHFEQAKARGRGIAFITGHCGNWELMALSFGARFQTMTSVAKRQGNPRLNDVLEKMRSGHGNSLVYRNGALRSLYAILRKNGIVGVHIDQASSPSDGELVDFLGRPAWTTNMMARMARRNGVPMLPVFIHREGARQVVQIHPEIALGAEDGAEAQDTALMTDCIAAYVVEHPTEWYWIHRRWKRAPQPDAASAPAVDPK